MIDRKLNYGRDIIRHFSSRLPQFDTVLDIGAGNGDDLMIYREFSPKSNLLALEGYKPNIHNLKSKKINVFKHNLETDKFPFGNETIDVINANQVLEHTKEVFWILHEVSRTLKVGGYFVIGVPNLASLHNRILLFFGKQPTSIKNSSAHIRGYTKYDLINLLEVYRGGYNLLDFKGSNFYPFPPVLAVPLAHIFPNMSWGIFLLLKKTKEYNDEFINWPIDNQLETNFYIGR